MFEFASIRIPGGIELGIVTGGTAYTGKVWRALARQIYCEHGDGGFWEIDHLPGGTPYIYNEPVRLSISHTDGCFVGATLRAPEGFDPAAFVLPTALGVDVERIDREKVVRLRERFLTEDECKIIASEEVSTNILAWCCKEAMLKAGLDSAVDWRHGLRILSLPIPGDAAAEKGKKGFEGKEGRGVISRPEGDIELGLSALRYGDFIIAVAHSRRV